MKQNSVEEITKSNVKLIPNHLVDICYFEPYLIYALIFFT
jgi:hypothetical protein